MPAVGVLYITIKCNPLVERVCESCVKIIRMERTAKMRQNDKTTNDKKPFSGFRILGVSFLILYIYYNIYII